MTKNLNGEPNKAQKKVVFLCTGNSCRSQMAEGFARYLGKNEVDVYSAGLTPAGINPLAIKVMREAGIDISKQTSDTLSQELIKDADLIVTLCGGARDNCPLVGQEGEHLHWPISDPARAEGTPKEIKQKFREARDEIHERVKELLCYLLNI